MSPVRSNKAAVRKNKKTIDLLTYSIMEQWNNKVIELIKLIVLIQLVGLVELLELVG